MKAFVFPGQGAQFVGMGKDLYDNNSTAKEFFEKANDILGYRITDIMFEGTDDDLKQTKVTQPAVFLHSVISAICMGDKFKPEMTAGHSLGEFSALVAAGALSFEDGLKLVYARAQAMQKACEAQPSTMAAIIGLTDEKVEQICEAVSKKGKGVCVAANYNNPGQLVISGDIDAIDEACEQLKAAGAKRALPLKVGGAFHSPLMQPAKDELQAAIETTEFKAPVCPVYQNVDGKAHTNPAEIKANLIAQLTSPVRWTQCVQNMIADGADDFTECGPGRALQVMIAKIDQGVTSHGIEENMVRKDAFEQSEYAAPRNEVECTLCDAFAKVLKQERVGIDDDFFYLGGDSISVMQLQQHLGMKHITTLVNSYRTPRKIAEQYAALEQAASSGVREDGLYPLMDIQQGYLGICLPLEGKPVMNLASLYQLDDAVDLNRFSEAIVKALDNHPAMFIRYHRTADGTIMQKIQKEAVTIEIEQLTDEAFATLIPDLSTAFRYFEDRLFKFRLFKTPSAQYFFHNIHHSVFDGVSKAIFYADIEKAYAGQDLEVEKDSYLNIAVDENAIQQTEAYAKAREELQDMIDHAPRTMHVAGAGAGYLDTVRKTLSVSASEAVAFCAEHHTTMNTLTTAAFVKLLGHETHSCDIFFGSQFSGRSDARVANMTGLFAKPIFMRFSWDKDMKPTDFLSMVGKSINQSIANSICSLGEIHADDPMFSQLQFVYQDQIPLEPTFGGQPTKVIDIKREQTPTTIVVNIYRNVDANSLTINFRYRADIFNKEKIEDMVNTYDEYLRGLM